MKIQEAMGSAKSLAQEVDREFGQAFGAGTASWKNIEARMRKFSW